MAVDRNQTQHDALSDDGLDAFFAAGRRTSDLPAPLMQRILADAATEIAGGPAEVVAVRRSSWRGILAAIGGWPAMAGMATATVAGLWLGFAGPSSLGDVLTFGTNYTLSDFMPSVDLTNGN